MVDLPIENGEFRVDLAIKHGGFIVDLAIKHGGSSHRFWYDQRLGPWIHRPRHRSTTTNHDHGASLRRHRCTACESPRATPQRLQLCGNQTWPVNPLQCGAPQ